MNKSYIFGSNTLIVARKFVRNPIGIEPGPDSTRAIESVEKVYDAIRKANIVSPTLSRTPTSI